MPIRNRIIAHETVKARDLIPHPLNFRKQQLRTMTAIVH
jgi:hypothetical protein